jgi:cobalt-zinc-cadmium efflux system membrane fusion protein
MSTAHIAAREKRVRLGPWIAFVAVIAAVAALWFGGGEARLKAWLAARTPAASADDHAEDEEHGHDHGTAEDPNLLTLTPQAQASMGLQFETVKLQPYERVISVPGIIVERPGKSRLQVTAPLTGVVTKIEVSRGAAVAPGQELFQMRLTHEELVQAQADFLRTAEELDVIGAEVQRLERLANEGTIAGKTLLERRYERQKAEAAQRAQRQALVLHGFSEAQVEEILQTRTLLQFLNVVAPKAEMTSGAETPPLYQVQELSVERGQHVQAGDTLAELSDHQTLLIEGTAFERDVPAIQEVATHGWKFSAVIDAESSAPLVINDLELDFLNAQVDPEARAFHFYVRLPNELLTSERGENQERFISWKFKPGQRVQIRVPVEKLEECIVLPAAAVARDGLESYVFQQDGGNLKRRPVRIEHQDPQSVVVANDGSLFPGDRLAANGAQQLLLAVKNKSGAAIDPHAGHNH